MNAAQHANRFWRLVSGASALVALIVLVVGIPLGLATFVGWPLPHHVPTISALHAALTTRGIPDQALLDGLACVAWLAWASIVLSVAEEIAAAAKGRSSSQIPIVGTFQPVAARLVAAVLFAGLALGRAAPATPPPVRAPLAVQLHPGAIALVADDVVTAAPSPTPSSPPDSTPSVSAPSISQPAGATTPVTYTVVRNDTLWSIAQTQLGDPLRWREIFALNEGRLQPDGRTLADPSWIYPGWVLDLPSVLPPPAATAPPPSPQPAAPITSDPVPDTTSPVASSGAIPPTSPAPPTGTAPTATSSTHPHGNGKEKTRVDTRLPPPVVLPSGSVIAPSFAAGVLAAVAIGRLRRRRRYRPSDPAPGRDLRPPRLGPTLLDVRRAVAASRTPADDPSAGDQPPAEWPSRAPNADFASAAPSPIAVASFTTDAGSPRQLEIGIRDDVSVLLDLATVGALNLAGPGVDDVIRAWCASFIAAGSPGTAEILTTDHVAATLFPGLHPTTALRAAASPESLLRSLEAEIVGRSRQLDDADLGDASSYREARPEDPLPYLLAIVDAVSETATTRWQAVLRSAGRLDVVVITLRHDGLAPAQIFINRDHSVTSASPVEMDARLRGTKLFGLNSNEATELIGNIIAAHDDGSAEAETDLLVPDPSPNQKAPEEREQEWPLEPATPRVDTGKPVQVRVLGPYQITVDGQEITKGLRSAGKELLAWYLLRPEGASAEAAVDALWPDTSPELVTKRFWRALGDLRSHLRHEDSDERYEVLIRSGDHYHPQRDQIACDLWEFQDSLSQATRASSDDEALHALRNAVDVYQGDFVFDVDYLWIEPVREDLHRRGLDAHLRLAELEEACGNPDAALDALSRSVDLDHYVEEVYRRLMALQARIGRPDSIAATWHQLQRNLAILEVDPEPATVRLFQKLSHGHDLAGAVGPGRR